MKKIINLKITALTGFILMLFLVHHALGSMLIMFGPETFNDFSKALTEHPAIHLARFVLIIVLLTHIYFGLKKNVSSKKFKQKIFSGLLIFTFTVYRILSINSISNFGRQNKRDLSIVMEKYFQSKLVIFVTLIGVILTIFHIGKKINYFQFEVVDDLTQKYFYFFKALAMVVIIVGFLTSIYIFSGAMKK